MFYPLAKNQVSPLNTVLHNVFLLQDPQSLFFLFPIFLLLIAGIVIEQQQWPAVLSVMKHFPPN